MTRIIQKMLETVSLLLTIAFILTTGCQQQKPDPISELKPIIDKYVEVWNTGNVDELDAIMGPNFVRYAVASPAEGLENLQKLITAVRTSFPDLYLVLTNEIFSENRFAAHFSFTATNTGPGQFPPTGKSVKVWGVVIANFANGKLTEEWVGYDNQSFLEQLGFTMVPPVQEITN